MSSRAYHERLTIFHTCWDAGVENCKLRGEPCGTDPRWAFCRTFKVPLSFPDGVYVFGHVWYGGLHYTRKKGHFPDFYSCSFVQVRGGPPRTCWPRHVPYFEPGEGNRVRWGKCHTSADRVGQCDRAGCKSTQSFYSIPAVFQNGKTPDPIQCTDIDQAFEQQDSVDTHLLNGICNYQVCCPKTCGACGGRRCHKRPGGGSNCCSTPILRKQYRTCDKYPAPCIRT